MFWRPHKSPLPRHAHTWDPRMESTNTSTGRRGPTDGDRKKLLNRSQMTKKKVSRRRRRDFLMWCDLPLRDGFFMGRPCLFDWLTFKNPNYCLAILSSYCCTFCRGQVKRIWCDITTRVPPLADHFLFSRHLLLSNWIDILRKKRHVVIA